jgi:hypothetical protein
VSGYFWTAKNAGVSERTRKFLIRLATIYICADHSSRGVLPTVVRRCVWSRNLKNEEALAHWGLSRQKQKKIYIRTEEVIFKSVLNQLKRISWLTLQNTK